MPYGLNSNFYVFKIYLHKTFARYKKGKEISFSPFIFLTLHSLIHAKTEMAFDIKMIKKVYQKYPEAIAAARK